MHSDGMTQVHCLALALALASQLFDAFRGGPYALNSKRREDNFAKHIAIILATRVSVSYDNSGIDGLHCLAHVGTQRYIVA
jgi:hypothetical protein